MAGGAPQLLAPVAGGDASITTAPLSLDRALFISPWVLLAILIVAFVTHSITTAEASTDALEPAVAGPGGKPLPRRARKHKGDREQQREFTSGQKLLFLWLSIGLIGTFIANGANIIIHSLSQREGDGWWCGEATAIYVCASAFVYSVFLISLLDTSPAPTIANQVTWVAALVAEVIFLGFKMSLYSSPHEDSAEASKPSRRKVHQTMTRWEIVEVTIDTTRVIMLFFLVGFYVTFTVDRFSRHKIAPRLASNVTHEGSPLLINGHANQNGHARPNGALNGNGTVPGNRPSELDVGTVEAANGQAPGRRSVDDAPAFYKPTTQPNRSWWEYLRGYSVFFPYLWPSKSLKLQIVVLVCFLLVVAQRVINIAVPLQIKVVTNKLTDQDGTTPGMPWVDIWILVVLRFLQGQSGILGAIRSVLWIPISQYSYRSLTTASFEHVHGLSLDFHLGKRTGEVLSALSKGNAINNFLEQITFQVAPMIFDLGVAIVYLGIAFDAYYALVVGIITFSYLYLTVRMARWRAEQRRQMTNLSREEDAVKNDSLMSYETVKYFNAEAYEFNRYHNAVRAFQKMEYKVTVSLNILNISQNMVFMTGLLITSFISAYQVTNGKRDVGDFVMLLTYMGQLQQPLNFFGSFYRGIQNAMISGERLLELFKEQPTVVDDEEAVPIPACEGQIRFNNVKFSYDMRKPALEDLSFTCRPGTTTAFVGESGGGKSTVFRLLFRFYNAQDGSIQLDGHDVRDITIDSLRSHIGVVPQDTVLFNETLMYNLKYANQDATDEDVYAACRAASIHDKIMNFPDRYETKVGERGLRLSGGEKQRVAIARTIIKNPRIIMLDEATAALDSDTEQNIQDALNTLSEGRTMLVIAHRLSTVTNAEQILVLHAGKVAEAGTHQELLALKGRYASMWRKQIRAERAAEAASQMVAKANALKQAAMERPCSSGDGGVSEEASGDEIENRRSITLTDPDLVTTALLNASEGVPDPTTSSISSNDEDSPRPGSKAGPETTTPEDKKLRDRNT